MVRIDTWIIARLTRAYWWLLDRTGVYVGTLMAVCMATVVALDFYRFEGAVRWGFIAADVLIFGGVSQIKWNAQHTETVERYNASVFATWEVWPLRTFMLLVFTGLCVAPAVTAVIGGTVTPVMFGTALYAVAIIFLNYLPCVPLRPREPKKFWEPEKELEPAPSVG